MNRLSYSLRPSLGLAALVVCGALLMTSRASATTVLKVSLETMTLASDLVVHGTVASSRAETVAGNERHVQTVVTIEVINVVKGDRSLKTVALTLPTGRVGRWARHTPGVPGFTPGEEVVLFLEKTSAGFAISGLSQGKFTVRTLGEGKSAKKLISRSFEGLHFVTRDPSGVLAPTSPPDDARIETLDVLLGEVRRVLSKGQTTR